MDDPGMLWKSQEWNEDGRMAGGDPRRSERDDGKWRKLWTVLEELPTKDD
jgi:hypothetical protein